MPRCRAGAAGLACDRRACATGAGAAGDGLQGSNTADGALVAQPESLVSATGEIEIEETYLYRREAQRDVAVLRDRVTGAGELSLASVDDTPAQYAARRAEVALMPVEDQMYQAALDAGLVTPSREDG